MIDDHQFKSANGMGTVLVFIYLTIANTPVRFEHLVYAFGLSFLYMAFVSKQKNASPLQSDTIMLLPALLFGCFFTYACSTAPQTKMKVFTENLNLIGLSFISYSFVSYALRKHPKLSHNPLIKQVPLANLLVGTGCLALTKLVFVVLNVPH